MRLIGLDPGLRTSGWGLVDVAGSRLSHVANGIATTNEKLTTAERLNQIFEQLTAIIETYKPDAAAVEETFVNKNPVTTLKLGLARGAVLLAPARAGLAVAEYSANAVKKAVVGVGHADKDQVGMMVRRLLPGVEIGTPDAADALAVAICHAHHAQTNAVWRAAAGSAA
jgi:crossover junction endodeoxyribonuclease RuvC